MRAIRLAPALLVFLLLSPAADARSVADVLARYGPAARARLAPHFANAGIPYPPRKVMLIGLKEERRLEVWAAQATGPYRLVTRYPFTAASGVAGPKLRKGDLQVPEGSYRIEGLNPDSNFHLSLRVNYPNAADRARAKEEGRTRLGGDIYLHGGAASIGCIAVGDEAVEELFTLVAEVRPADTKLLIAPRDLRDRPAPKAEGWVAALYAQLERELKPFRCEGDCPLAASSRLGD